MITELIPQLQSLSLAKKRVLISELLAEVYGEPVEESELASALNERIEHYRANPATGKSWAEGTAKTSDTRSRP